MLNSKQEKVVGELSQKSLGAHFIFEPDEFKKGNATREPADLVWACNNCIFLFYMKANKGSVGKEESVVKEGKRSLLN
jgi:hypothetical protein